jgi:hypothetical protein
MKTQHRKRREASAKGVDSQKAQNLSDNDWRDNHKVISAFKSERDKFCEYLGIPWNEIDSKLAHNSSKNKKPHTYNTTLLELVGRCIARELRENHWGVEKYHQSGIADWDDDVIRDDMHFLTHECLFHSRMHMEQAAKILRGLVRRQFNAHKHGSSSLKMLGEVKNHYQLWMVSIDTMEDIQDTYFEKVSEKEYYGDQYGEYDPYIYHPNCADEIVAWCQDNDVKLASLELTDGYMLDLLLGIFRRDFLLNAPNDQRPKGLPLKEDFNGTDAYDWLFDITDMLHWGTKLELSDFRHKVLDQAYNSLDISMDGDNYRDCVAKLDQLDVFLRTLEKEAA